ncbi:hypothetical protein [Noviherbaspirillum agri]
MRKLLAGFLFVGAAASLFFRAWLFGFILLVIALVLMSSGQSGAHGIGSSGESSGIDNDGDSGGDGGGDGGGD